LKTFMPIDDDPSIIEEEVTLAKAQQLVEGWVEVIHMPMHDAQILMNEEGRLKNMQPNLPATMAAGQSIVGPAILLTGEDKWT